jgi:hypothetical protein
MLNVDVARNNTNDQYQVRLLAEINAESLFVVFYHIFFLYVMSNILNTGQKFLTASQTLDNAIRWTYTTRSECSIEFEVDGPYKVTKLYQI